MRRAWLAVVVLAGCAHAAAEPAASLPSAPPVAAVDVATEPPALGEDLRLRDEPKTPPHYVLTYERPQVSAYCDEEEVAAAKTTLDAYGRAVARLRPGADARLLYLDLLQILAGPCMHLTAGEGVPQPPSNGLALQTWWVDGGERWLRAHVQLADFQADDRTVVVPPTMRRTLTRDLNRKHPLADWMCSSADLDCVDDIERAYAARMRDDLVLEVSGKHKLSMSWADHVGTQIEFGWDACADTAALADDSHAYAAYRDCVELATARAPALPISGLRAPDEGWLLLQGRRGHYGFCDEVRAYDLGSGATYIARVCGELFSDCKPGECTAPEIQVERGNVQPATVREALWAAMWTPEAEPDVVLVGETYPLPEKVEPRRPARPELPRIDVSGWSSAHTQLTWSHTADGKHRFDGTLDWPSGANLRRGYATAMVQAMEATLEPGCPRAALPEMPIYERAYGVSAIDAHPSELAVTQRALVEALREAAKQPCTE